MTRALSWLTLASLTGGAFASVLVADPTAARAEPMQSSSFSDSLAKKGKATKGKKGKAKGSMDDKAGESDSGLAPGSDDVKTAKKASSQEEPPAEPASEPAPEAAAPEPVPAPPPEPEPVEEGPKIRKNWFSLSIQKEALFYTQVQDVCEAEDADGNRTPAAPQYSCRDANGLYDGTVYAGSGNQIQSGIGLATMRVLVGYDRVLIERLTIGGRLGYAFGGAPTVAGGGAFVPFHAELRSAFYFGDKPFERNGLRPFASLGVGVGEVDGKVSVDFFVDQQGYQDGKRGNLDAWRKTGTAFGALGAGLAYPIGPIALTLEARGLMMFGESAFALALAGGVAYGI